MFDHTSLAGGITGFLIALGIDLHAYGTSDGPFNWTKAAARWGYGAILGFTGGKVGGTLLG